MPRRRAALTLGCFLLGAGPLAAQSFLAGIVREDSSGRPLPGVEVLIEGTRLKATTGPNGRYLIDQAEPGRRMVLFRMVGYLPSRTEVQLRAGDTTWANALLVPRTVVLDSIIVKGEPSRPRGEGVEAFEERRRLGFGKFYDSLDIRRNEHLRIEDLVRRQGGVTIERRKVDGVWYMIAFNPYMRNPMTGALNCPMQIYHNGSKYGDGGTTQARPIDMAMFDLASLQAIEVYRSTGQVPAIYSGPTAACGVILLWSR